MTSEELVKETIKVIGDDPNREGLKDTPRRVVKSYKELFRGYEMNEKEILSTTFDPQGYDQIVLLKNIEMYSTCEHHMIPFVGTASVGYIPRKRVVGLSKLARLVEMYSRRLQIQERLTNEIAHAINDVLNPFAVGVVIDAQHFCMRARGVNKQSSSMVTSCMLGAFRKNIPARQEFLDLLK